MTVVLIPVIHKYGVGAIPTLEGFAVGIAIVIALQQLPLALGVTQGSGDRTVIIARNSPR